MGAAGGLYAAASPTPTRCSGYDVPMTKDEIAQGVAARGPFEKGNPNHDPRDGRFTSGASESIRLTPAR